MATNSNSLTKAQLKDKVLAIVLLQGNDFIKELLRQNGAKIGATKADFAKNIIEAIESETLTQAKIEAWLDELEGWGNQHIYLFEAPTVAVSSLQGAFSTSPHKALVGAPQSYKFPSDLELSNINLDGLSLSLVWHLGKEGWDRAKAKDFVRDEGQDRYRYEAHRRRVDRSLVRFEWKFSDGHCAILIHRNQDIDHDVVMSVVWTLLQSLNIVTTSRPRIPLTQAVKSASKTKGTKSARLEADGGFVDLVSTLEDGGIDKVAAVRHTRNAMKDDEFSRAQGIFSLGSDEGLAQTMSVQVFGSEARVRLWAQCKRDDVYTVVAYLLKHNKASDGA